MFLRRLFILTHKKIDACWVRNFRQLFGPGCSQPPYDELTFRLVCAS